MRNDQADLSIIIVTYNSAEDIAGCLGGLVDLRARLKLEVIVLDNASEDDTTEIISQQFSWVTLLPQPENLGFGRGCNLAASHASAPYLLLLNPDTIPTAGAVEKLLQFARANPRARIWGGRSRSPDGRPDYGNVWRFPSLWNQICRFFFLSAAFPNNPVLNGEVYGGWDRDSIRQVDAMSGCFLMIEQDLWQELGGFDPAYFMFSEEVDLCYRARRLGAAPLFSPDAEIIHLVGRSYGDSPRRIIYILKGKITFIDRHWRGLTRHLGHFVIALWPLSRFLGFRILGVLPGFSRFTEAAEKWRYVWQQRADWRRGYER